MNEHTWDNVQNNDRILIHYKDIDGLTKNEVFEASVLSFTIRRDYAQIVDGKAWSWIKIDDYELVEILPPLFKKKQPTED